MFKVYKEPCKNCLLSSDRIVSGERMKDIILECKKNQQHFICHKASMNGDDICCKTFYDELGNYSQLIRIAKRINAVEFVEQTDTEKLPTYQDMNKNR